MVRQAESFNNNPDQRSDLSVNQLIKNTLVGSSSKSRELHRQIGELSIKDFDLLALNSLHLKVDTQTLNHLPPDQEKEVVQALSEIKELSTDLSDELIKAAVAEASNQQRKDFTFPVPQEHQKSYRALVTLLLVLVSIFGYIKPAEAKNNPQTATETPSGLLPTVTPQPEKTPTPTDVLPTVTPTKTSTPEIVLPTATPESKETIITAQTTTDLNARTGAGTNFDVEILIPEGTKVIILGSPESDWVQVTFTINNKTYGEEKALYVSKKFLTEPQTETVIHTQEDQESQPVVTTEPITSSESITVSQNLTEAVGGSTSPVTYDATGFPTAEEKNGAVEKVEPLTMAEFAALTEIEGQKKIEELPKKNAYDVGNGTFAIKKFTDADVAAAKFAVTQEGIYVSIPLTADKDLVMKWEGGIEYRANWKILQFDGQKVTLSISAAYYDDNSFRDGILEGKKQDLLAIHNGTIQEAQASPQRSIYINNPDATTWYEDEGFLEPNAKPISYTPEYDSSIKLDNLITAFQELVSANTVDGKIAFPKLKKEVDANKKVEITIWRFPDKKAELGWNGSNASPLPQYFYQVSDEGQLIVHLSVPRTGSHNLSSLIEGAFAQILVDEFSLKPEEMDGNRPTFHKIDNSLFDLVKIDDNTQAVILPLYVDVGEENDRVVIKPD